MLRSGGSHCETPHDLRAPVETASLLDKSFDTGPSGCYSFLHDPPHLQKRFARHVPGAELPECFGGFGQGSALRSRARPRACAWRPSKYLTFHTSPYEKGHPGKPGWPFGVSDAGSATWGSNEGNRVV